MTFNSIVNSFESMSLRYYNPGSLPAVVRSAGNTEPEGDEPVTSVIRIQQEINEIGTTWSDEGINAKTAATIAGKVGNILDDLKTINKVLGTVANKRDVVQVKNYLKDLDQKVQKICTACEPFLNRPASTTKSEDSSKSEDRSKEIIKDVSNHDYFAEIKEECITGLAVLSVQANFTHVALEKVKTSFSARLDRLFLSLASHIGLFANLTRVWSAKDEQHDITEGVEHLKEAFGQLEALSHLSTASRDFTRTLRKSERAVTDLNSRIDRITALEVQNNSLGGLKDALNSINTELAKLRDLTDNKVDNSKTPSDNELAERADEQISELLKMVETSTAAIKASEASTDNETLKADASVAEKTAVKCHKILTCTVLRRWVLLLDKRVHQEYDLEKATELCNTFNTSMEVLKMQPEFTTGSKKATTFLEHMTAVQNKIEKEFEGLKSKVESQGKEDEENEKIKAGHQAEIQTLQNALVRLREIKIAADTELKKLTDPYIITTVAQADKFKENCNNYLNEINIIFKNHFSNNEADQLNGKDEDTYLDAQELVKVLNLIKDTDINNIFLKPKNAVIAYFLRENDNSDS